MNEMDQIANHDQFAKSYDAQVKEYKSYGHDVLFGMCYEYVKHGEKLLDLGIGTGLSSINFAKAGVDIFGLDGSKGMLYECRKKGFAKELKQYDINKVPLPYPDNSFNHVICCGVYHFFGELIAMLKDAVRILKPGGILAFTVASLIPEDNEARDFMKEPTAWGISLFKHTDEYINRIAYKLNLEVLKEQKLLVNSGDQNAEDLLFKVFIMKNIG